MIDGKAKLAELTALLPEAMADLMKKFIDRKDLNGRTEVRLQMLGLLDFASADTEYTPNPLKQNEDPGGLARVAIMQQQNPVMPYVNGQGFTPRAMAAVPAVTPIAGARRIDNADILGSS